MKPMVLDMNSIQAALKQMDESKRIVFLQLSSEEYLKMTEDNHISHLVKTKNPIVYITASKPVIKLQEKLCDKDRDSIFFIDMATGTGATISKRSENALFIASPRELTELSIAVCTSADMFGDKKRLVVLDNIATLVMENDERSVEKFVRFLTSKIRAAGDMGLLIHVTEQKDDRMTANVLQFCDDLVKI